MDVGRFELRFASNEVAEGTKVADPFVRVLAQAGVKRISRGASAACSAAPGRPGRAVRGRREAVRVERVISADRDAEGLSAR